MNDESAMEPVIVEKPKDSRTLPVAGIAITGAWLTALTAYCLYDSDRIITLAPNELGDFTAGAFAPLAFFWLVLGFFQQGQELRNSGNALWLQGHELQNSVEQQRELVKVTREQLQFESELLKEQRLELLRSSKPIFRVKSGGSIPSGDTKTRNYDVILHNVGRPCTDVEVSSEDPELRATTASLGTGDSWSFSVRFEPKGACVFRIRVSYLDERLMTGRAEYLVTFSRGVFEFAEQQVGI